MSLITDRPTHWNEVIGQERAQRVLAGVIRNPSLMTRGFVFTGPQGVGKTTMAYLFAKAVMCLTDRPLDCSDCPSCRLFTADDIEQKLHPDFEDIDAASYSGVNAARELLTTTLAPAQCSKRRVVLVDEAHRLSREAWDVYLKPLELRGTEAIFIFSTTERVNDPRTAIPKTILSRSTVLDFSLVDRDSLVGLLMARCDGRKIAYTLDGLRRVAELAGGKPRDALKLLQTVALTGPVTPDNCSACLVADLHDTATSILQKLVESTNNAKSSVLIAEALNIADRAAQEVGTSAVVSAMFQTYARKFFENSEIARSFTNYKAVTALFLKWTQVQQLPIDALPLLLMELSDYLPGGAPVLADPGNREIIRVAATTSRLLQDNSASNRAAPAVASAEDLAMILGATE